jgi:4-hydroxythreonine-4-phosphate dehydrogenase
MKNNLIKIKPPLKVLITMGEPAGIGPELLVRIAQNEFSEQIIVLADSNLLIHTAEQLKLPLALTEIDWDKPAKKHQAGHLYIENHLIAEPVIVGELNTLHAETTLSTLSRASELALDNSVDAIVTAPVHKANLNQVDQTFLGHTEFFADKANINKVIMMLATNDLRVTLATTHLPLLKVPAAITKNNLRQVFEVIFGAFEKLGIANIKLGVCGLNPHAGEDGLLGTEEIEIISPVITEFQEKGYQVSGPYPADTLFTLQKRKQFDVFLAMYHDQGLPVVKSFGFGQCANVTLGLPYIRTSVDHGTALDIAATYSASADSLEYAINYAIHMASGTLP